MVYREMASIYDQLMSHVPYERWIAFMKEMIQHAGKQKVETIADLGCGTGSITTALASEGYKLFGVDKSSDMLTYAADKASSQHVSIDWICQDIRYLEGLREIDVAVSFFDVINYITREEDLLKAFSRIGNILNPSGLFIFDIHSKNQVETNYINQTFADVQEDVSYIWFCSEGSEPGEMCHELTFFTKAKGVYHRFDEIHHQKTYPISLYVQLLKRAGFVNIHFYHDFSINTKNQHIKSERIFFLAQKRMG